MKEFSNVWLVVVLLVVAVVCATVGVYLLMSSKQTQSVKEKENNQNAVHRALADSTETKIYNLIIIDESGSMSCIRQQAMDSVNETIQTIRAAQERNENQEHFVTLVTFNDTATIVNDCAPINEIKELTADSYCPDCCTALYDAMGISLNALRKKVSKGDKVLVTIVTDGYENASQEYSCAAIKALVEELKAEGWVFAYLGANQDAEKVAFSMSIDNAMSWKSTREGTVHMSRKLNNSRARWYDDAAYNRERTKDFFEE